MILKIGDGTLASAIFIDLMIFGGRVSALIQVLPAGRKKQIFAPNCQVGLRVP